MDNGEVLPGLNDTWTFLGANALEWASGLVIFLLVGEVAGSPAGAMPLMILSWVITTTSLASIRKLHPDEQRGVRNVLMTACGVAPPGIPAPASIQPLWSASPMRKLPDGAKFKKLGLDKVLPCFSDTLEEAEV